MYGFYILNNSGKAVIQDDEAIPVCVGAVEGSYEVPELYGNYTRTLHTGIPWQEEFVVYTRITSARLNFQVQSGPGEMVPSNVDGFIVLTYSVGAEYAPSGARTVTFRVYIVGVPPNKPSESEYGINVFDSQGRLVYDATYPEFSLVQLFDAPCNISVYGTTWDLGNVGLKRATVHTTMGYWDTDDGYGTYYTISAGVHNNGGVHLFTAKHHATGLGYRTPLHNLNGNLLTVLGDTTYADSKYFND